MGKRDLPDIYALARGPQAQGRGHTYQANPDCPCYILCDQIRKNLRFYSLRNRV